MSTPGLIWPSSFSQIISPEYNNTVVMIFFHFYTINRSISTDFKTANIPHTNIPISLTFRFFSTTSLVPLGKSLYLLFFPWPFYNLLNIPKHVLYFFLSLSIYSSSRITSNFTIFTLWYFFPLSSLMLFSFS